MTMPIDNTGKFRKEVESADYKYAAANHRFFRTRRELVFRITWTFFSILGQKELIGALEFSEKALEEHRTITGRLLKARKAATVDLLRTEVRLADIKQRQIKEKNLLNIQLFMLNNLLGLDTDASDLDISGDLVLSELPANLHEKARMACLHRHDYIALEALVSSREKRLQIAKAGYAPNLSFLASYGNTWSIGATTGDPSRSEDEGQVGMAMSVPLFTGGRIKSEIRRERNLLQTMKQELRKLKLQIKLEVETAQSNIESTRARVGVTEKAVEQAKESLRIEQKKHSVGKGAIIDVLDAQSALLDSQTNYYRALADYNSALAQFKLSLGER
jgi:outer membrane protein TolC